MTLARADGMSSEQRQSRPLAATLTQEVARPIGDRRESAFTWESARLVPPNQVIVDKQSLNSLIRITARPSREKFLGNETRCSSLSDDDCGMWIAINRRMECEICCFSLSSPIHLFFHSTAREGPLELFGSLALELYVASIGFRRRRRRSSRARECHDQSTWSVLAAISTKHIFPCNASRVGGGWCAHSKAPVRSCSKLCSLARSTRVSNKSFFLFSTKSDARRWLMIFF